MSPTPIEWCSFKKGTNVLYSMLVDLIKETAPGLIHKCPYVGRVDVKNMTLNVSEFLSVFNQGDYRISVFYTELGKNDLFRLIFGLNNKSDIKSSFG